MSIQQQTLSSLWSVNHSSSKHMQYSKNVSEIRVFIQDNLKEILTNQSTCLLQYFAKNKYWSRDLDYTIRALGPLHIERNLMNVLITKLKADLNYIRYHGENLDHLLKK